MQHEHREQFEQLDWREQVDTAYRRAGMSKSKSNEPAVRQVEMVRIDAIDVNERHRPVTDEAVEALLISTRDIGIRSPITVCYHPHRPMSDGSFDDSHVLVAGAHRLAAAKRMGLKKIPCFVVEDELKAELWEISENLHRAELTALERADHTARWIELSDRRTVGALVQATSGKAAATVGETVSAGGRGSKGSSEVSGQVDQKPPAGGRPEGGISAAARELGIGRKDAERAVRVASLSPEAKEAARTAGLADNRTALLEAAKETTPQAQVQALLNRKPVNRPKIEANKVERAIREVALIVTKHVPPNFWMAVRLNLEAAGAVNIAKAIAAIEAKQ